MRTVLFLVCCFFTMMSVSSQQLENQKNIVREKYAVTLMPAFFPDVKMGLQPGFQFKIGRRFALMNEAAFPIVVTSKNKGNSYDETKFFRMSSELKFFRAKSPEGRFGSFQLGFSKRSFVDNDSGSYHSKDDTVLTGYSSLKIASPVFFCALKMGGEVVQWKKVFMDFFIGIGIRLIPTKYHVEGAYVKGPWFPPKDFILLTPDPAWQNDKTSIRPHFSMGFRIGRKF